MKVLELMLFLVAAAMLPLAILVWLLTDDDCPTTD